MIMPRMQMPLFSRWAPRWSTFLLALLLGVSMGYWVLRWPQAPVDVSAAAEVPQASGPVNLDARALTRLFGSDSVAVASPVATPSSRMRLLGVVADPRGGGAAVIALDGLAPRSYRVGAVVTDGLLLQSVSPGRASLAPDLHAPVTAVLEVPRIGK